jgi:hypothetical protein
MRFFKNAGGWSVSIYDSMAPPPSVGWLHFSDIEFYHHAPTGTEYTNVGMCIELALAIYDN